MKLRSALEGCSLGLLREIAARHRVTADASVLRRELVERVAAALSQPERLEAEIQRLPTEAAWLLGQVAWQEEGEAAGARVRRASQLALGLAVADIEQAIRGLCVDGWLYRAFRSEGDARGEWLCVPEELQAVARTRTAPPEPPPQPVSAPAEPATPGWPPLDVMVLAAALDRRDGLLAAADLDALPGSGMVGTPDGEQPPRRWRLLGRLSVRLGWLSRRGERLVPTPELERALREPWRMHERLWAVYVRPDIERPRPRQSARAAERGETRAWRAAVADLLSELGLHWYAWPELRAWMLRRLPKIAETGAPADAGGAPDASGGTDKLERMALGELTWLGVVELDSTDALPRVRVSEAGAALVRGAPLSPPGERVRAELTTDGRLGVPPGARLDDVFRAVRYLRPLGPGAWRLGRDTFLDGLAAGGSAADAAARLAPLAGVEAPRWERQLIEWERHARSGRLVETLLLDLRAHPQGAALVQECEAAGLLEVVTGPGLALVRRDALDALITQLRERGLLLEARPGGSRARRHPGEWLADADLALALMAVEEAARRGRGERARALAELAVRLRGFVRVPALKVASAALARASAGRRPAGGRPPIG